MELRIGNVTRRQMAELGVHRLEVAAVIAVPDSVDAGDVLTRHAARIAGRMIVVYTLRDSEPLMVMTVEVP